MLYKDFDLQLTGSRIRITPLTSDDADDYARLMFGTMYDRFLSLLGPGAVETDLPQILSRTADHETHAIRPMDSDAFWGWIVLQHDGEKPDIGIHLIPEKQGEGYGPEAVRLFASHLAAAYGLSRLFMRTTQGNTHSQRMMEKLRGVCDGIGPFCSKELGGDIQLLHYHFVIADMMSDYV